MILKFLLDTFNHFKLCLSFNDEDRWCMYNKYSWSLKIMYYRKKKKKSHPVNYRLPNVLCFLGLKA